jgi:hypothetical protein
MEVVPKLVTRTLCLIALVLVLLHLTTQTLRIYGGHANQLGFVRQFNLTEENNISTWFSSSIFLACSLLLGLIGWSKRGTKGPDARNWLSLAAIFLYLSMDEASSLHEMLIPQGDALFERTGYFNPHLFSSWLPFGATVVAIVGFVSVPFLKNLPNDTRRRFLLAACVYLSGAVGTEMAGGAIAYYLGADGMPYATEVAVEEGLEMLGVIAFLYGILMHLRREDISAAIVRRLLQLFEREEERVTPPHVTRPVGLTAVRRR